MHLIARAAIALTPLPLYIAARAVGVRPPRVTRRRWPKMSKLVKRYEKENGALRARATAAEAKIVTLAAENAKQVASVTAQRDGLKGLCKTLQDERKTAREQIGRLSGQLAKLGAPVDLDADGEEAVVDGDAERAASSADGAATAAARASDAAAPAATADA